METAASSGFQFQSGVNEGFTIPINSAISIADEIEAGHFSANVHRGATAFLGIYTSSSGYFRGPSFQAGALIVGVVPASPAEKAGLVAGDVITSLGGQSITSPTALTNAVLAASPGMKVGLSFGLTNTAPRTARP